MQSDIELYGEARDAPVTVWLQAGPVRVKYQDGELRYLHVGEQEIVRRIYFAVRDTHWDTAMPVFSRQEVQQERDSFRIVLEAVAQNPFAHYRWSGEIVGAADGTITFTVQGEAVEAFSSPRIGLNILYGTEALAGQAFETVHPSGAVTADIFPVAIDPRELFACDFHTLRYTTADGVTVSCAVIGARVDMEDQRNFCDSSYKALSWLPYAYPAVPTGQTYGETLTLSVTGPPRQQMPVESVTRVTLGAATGTLMPAIWVANADEPAPTFVTLNRARDPYLDAVQVGWAFNPAAHMPDDDTFMENTTTVADQAATVRGFAPAALLRVAPISFDSPYPRTVSDPRNSEYFAAAWVAALAGELARAGVGEAGFAVGAGADAVIGALAVLHGCPIYTVTCAGPLPCPVRAFAVKTGESLVLWLVNITDQPQAVQIEGASSQMIELPALSVRQVQMTT